MDWQQVESAASGQCMDLQQVESAAGRTKQLVYMIK